MLDVRRLYVVQNFSRQVTRLDLSRCWTSARTAQVLPTPADRSFTTAKRIGGRLRLVGSKFGFAPAQASRRTGWCRSPGFDLGQQAGRP